MQSTRTYSELLDYTRAISVATESSNATSRLTSLHNMAARRAYERTLYWDRFLVVAEPRTVTRGDIATTEDSFHVYGAGTDAANGLYVRNGTVNGKAAYRLYDSDGTTELYSIEWDNSSDWQLLDVNDAVIYDITDSSTTPPTSGWAANTGTAPAPLLVDVADIGTFIAVDQFDVYTDRTARPIDFHLTSRGATLHTKLDIDTAYVTYKKPLTDLYGDGTGGTVTTVPEEWFNYMALYAAYMFQQGERNSSTTPYSGFALAEVESALDDALMNLEYQGTIGTVGHRVSTHLNTSTSLI